MDIKLHEPTILLGPTLKRKRDEGGYSQSEEAETGSDEEFGWNGDDHIIARDHEVDAPGEPTAGESLDKGHET